MACSSARQIADFPFICPRWAWAMAAAKMTTWSHKQFAAYISKSVGGRYYIARRSIGQRVWWSILTEIGEREVEPTQVPRIVRYHGYRQMWKERQ
jgi:hypothetical protein